jgi:hypothetical protein
LPSGPGSEAQAKLFIDAVRTVAKRFNVVSDARIKRLGHFFDDAKRFRKSFAGRNHNIVKTAAGHFRLGRDFSADIPVNIAMSLQSSLAYGQGVSRCAQFMTQGFEIST